MLVGVTQALGWYPGTQELREQLLEQAASAYERFAAEDVDDPELRAQLARILVLLGDVRRQLDKAGLAEQAFRDADAILTELERSAGDVIDVHLESTVCLRKLGDACAVQGRYEEAQEALDRAESLAEQLSSPADRGYQLAQILLSRALVSLGAEDVETAETLLRRAEAGLRALLDANQGDEVKCRQALAMVNSTLGQALTADGRDDEAILALMNARAAHRELSEAEPDDPSHVEGLIVTNIRLANSLRTSGRPEEEHEALKNAIKDCDLLLAALPDVPRFRESRAVAQANLARVLHFERANDEARVRVDEALEVFAEMAESPFVELRHRQELAIALTIRGQVLRDLRETESADADFYNAVQNYLLLMQKQPDAFGHVLGVAMMSKERGRYEHLMDDHETAKEEYATAVAAFERVLEQKADHGPAVDGLADCLERFGDLMLDLQKSDEAVGFYEKALARRQQLREFPMYEFRKASLLLKLGNASEALAIARKLAKANPDNGMFATVLAAAHLRAGNADECIDALDGLAPELRDQACPELEFWFAMAHHVRNEPGDSEKAKELFDQAIERMNAVAPGCVVLLRLRAEAAATLGIPDATLEPRPKPTEGPSNENPGDSE